MSHKAKVLIACSFLLGFFLLTGCSSNMSDLTDWVSREQAKKAKPLKPLPVIKTYEDFIYPEHGMRDPFVMAESLQKHASASKKGPKPDIDRPKQPLERFSLDSLYMVGTLGSGSSMLALIQDPEKKVHRVAVGQYMGQNYGHIESINNNKIELKELIADGEGGWEERSTSLSLVTK